MKKLRNSFYEKSLFFIWLCSFRVRGILLLLWQIELTWLGWAAVIPAFRRPPCFKLSNDWNYNSIKLKQYFNLDHII